MASHLLEGKDGWEEQLFNGRRSLAILQYIIHELTTSLIIIHTDFCNNCCNTTAAAWGAGMIPRKLHLKCCVSSSIFASKFSFSGYSVLTIYLIRPAK
jgi:hypothetical protein